MLYALRYQKQATSNIASLVASLKEQGVSAEDAQVGPHCIYNGSVAHASTRSSSTLFLICLAQTKGRRICFQWKIYWQKVEVP